MYQIFSGLDHLKRGEQVDKDLTRLVTQQKQRLQTAMKYYQKNYYDVHADHPLMRLGYSLPWGYKPSPIDYYNRAAENIKFIAPTIGITTNQTPGTGYHNAFYGHDTISLLCSDTQPSNQIKIIMDNDWRTITPVRVIRIPFMHSPYERPDLIESKAMDENYAIIGIDIPAFAGMYQGWSLENMERPSSQQEQPEDFLGRYVFSNMIPSQMDALIRRGVRLGPFSSEWKNIKMPGYFKMADHTHEILEHTYDLLSRPGISQMNWFGVLSEIPSFVHQTMNKQLPLPKETYTSNNQWVSLASLVETASLCARFTPTPPDRTSLMNLWHIYNQNLTNGQWMAKLLPKEIRSMVEKDYQDFVSLLSA